MATPKCHGNIIGKNQSIDLASINMRIGGAKASGYFHKQYPIKALFPQFGRHWSNPETFLIRHGEVVICCCVLEGSTVVDLVLCCCLCCFVVSLMGK